jgi:glucose-6-phosphate 1-epimerase
MVATRFLSLLCAALASIPLTASAQESEPPLASCVASLRKELPEHREISAQTFDTYTREAHDLRPLIDNATRAQPEFQIPIWDYLARRVDPQRIEDGRALLQQEGPALERIGKTQGVEPAVAVAVFGIETDYGRVVGRYPVVDATLSRACLNLGSRERKKHFFDALWLLQQGVVKPDDFNGSWAGAFGMTQFMPGTFRQFMADGDGSGSPDIVHSVPDALATTARYLRSMGWNEGTRWGVEVRVPATLSESNALEGDHACLAEDKPGGKCRTLKAWSEAGVTRVDGAPLVQRDAAAGGLGDASTPAALLMPAGAQGPAWLVTPNYQAIWRYNRADTYALAIGLLSDALRGLPARVAAWPTDDPGLSRAEFRELQSLLLEHGHCDVRVDGSEGPRTGAAIRAEETRLGLPETGHAGTRLLSALRERSAETVACPLASR